jgi:hypothetical protein
MRRFGCAGQLTKNLTVLVYLEKSTLLFKLSFSFPFPNSLFFCYLTPWSRVLLKKLPGSEPVKKFSAFHATRKFIAALSLTAVAKHETFFIRL